MSAKLRNSSQIYPFFLAFLKSNLCLLPIYFYIFATQKPILAVKRFQQIGTKLGLYNFSLSSFFLRWWDFEFQERELIFFKPNLKPNLTKLMCSSCCPIEISL